MARHQQDQLRFDGRVAVVTGSGGGLGREYALLLGRRGARVIVNHLSNAATESTVQQIIAEGGEAVGCPGSVAERSTAKRIIQTAIDTFGKIDIVINNAGTGRFSSFEECDDDLYHLMVSSHLYGSWAVTQEAWPHLQRQKHGRIVMVTSTAALGQPHSEAYGAAKGAIIGLMRCLAVDGAKYGINVNALAPGGYTPTTDTEVKDEAMARTMKKFLPTHSVAPTPVWLAHEDCSGTGEIIGGFGPSFFRYFIGQTNGFVSRVDGFSVEVVDSGNFYVGNI
ncbi:3-oxoacyl-acp reductase [Fusarium albosuccineum]|uniref:3-oxoacyl-acp reductase n=1 Tax=Fusarium albosuccineum TaxID=1237068 RepID=A0A8H4PBK7_9HYPO|nr:3-oxoacyl-acp reductase [Fusarium albosuccineum]